MEEIFALFTDTTVITNVVSIVGAALLALVIKVIKNSVSSLNSEKVNYKRMDAVALLAYQTARMYKNALLNSNLTADAKVQAANDFAVIETTYQDYLDEYTRDEIVAEQATKVPVTAAPAIATVAALVQDKVVDQIEQLRSQLDNK